MTIKKLQVNIYCTLEDDRALYYAAMSIAAQGERGNDWRYEVAPVIGIYFLNFRQEGLGQAFRTDFGVTKTHEMFAHTAQKDSISLSKMTSSKLVL